MRHAMRKLWRINSAFCYVGEEQNAKRKRKRPALVYVAMVSLMTSRMVTVPPPPSDDPWFVLIDTPCQLLPVRF